MSLFFHIDHPSVDGDLWRRAGSPAAEGSHFVWPGVYTKRCKENDMEPLGKLREKSQMVIKENKALFQ